MRNRNLFILIGTFCAFSMWVLPKHSAAQQVYKNACINTILKGESMNVDGDTDSTYIKNTTVLILIGSKNCLPCIDEKIEEARKRFPKCRLYLLVQVNGMLDIFHKRDLIGQMVTHPIEVRYILENKLKTCQQLYWFFEQPTPSYLIHRSSKNFEYLSL